MSDTTVGADALTDDARAFRGAALQALSTLSRLSVDLGKGIAELSHVLNQSPDSMLADPDSPVNVFDTLTTTRAELAACREALEPFARAYTNKMAPLEDVTIDVFVDTHRPERTRSIRLGDLKAANRAFTSMSLGHETVQRLRQLEEAVRTAATFLASVRGADDAELFDARNLSGHLQKLAPSSPLSSRSDVDTAPSQPPPSNE